MDARTEAGRLGREAPDGPEAGEAGRPGHARRRTGWLIGGAILLAVLVAGGGIYWWLSRAGYASTSDARIAGNVTQVAPRIAGQVTDLPFKDNQHVTAGQLLVRLDPRDLQAKLDQAEALETAAQAQLTQAQAQLQVRQASLDQAQADVAVAQSGLTQASRTYERYQHLSPGASTQQQRDEVDAAFRSATARLNAARQGVEGAKAQIAVANASIAAARAGVKQAEAAAQQARLERSYADIVAPVAGRVTHRTVNLGDVVQPGQPMFALVQDSLWVEADFKETELAGMRPGDTVTISVDAVPGKTFQGRVDSFQDGTGAAFSALPAENATGNWVKVVQRVPVKITFTGDDYQSYFLAPGMSAEPRVKLH